MVRIGTRQGQCEGWKDGEVTPFAKETIRKMTEEARGCQVYVSGRGKWEVVDGKTSFPIDLARMECKCGKWQISGLPCKHAMKVIGLNRLNPQAYVNDYFSVRRYKLAYNWTIPPLPDHTQWGNNEFAHINPPEVKRTVGRPPRNRRRQPGEQPKGMRSKTIRCSKCGETGHNYKGCKGGKTAKEKAAGGQVNQKKRGREEGVCSQGNLADVTKKKRTPKKKKKTN